MLLCQHILCADPFSGCNISCCRLFRRRVRCLRSWSYTQWCRWSWWTHLSSKSSAVIVLDGLKPCLAYLISSEIFDVISVWLLLCYKSSICTVRVSITDPGMTLVHSSTGHLRSGRYKVGIRAHADCRTRPLSLSPRKLLSSHFWPLSTFYSFRNGECKEQVHATRWRHAVWSTLEGSHQVLEHRNTKHHRNLQRHITRRGELEDSSSHSRKDVCASYWTHKIGFLSTNLEFREEHGNPHRYGTHWRSPPPGA